MKSCHGFLVIFSMLALIGCTKKTAVPGGKLLSGTVDPAPADTTSIESQWKRYIGQTSFLNYQPPRFFPRTMMKGGLEGVPQSAAVDAPGGRRDIQESDVFKIGKSGSKLLYLLNSYRGLQVVSFADGSDKPKLLSRVASTGNYPNDMYYVESRDRLYVLERLYYDQNDEYMRERNSRVLVYDVSNPAQPKMLAKETLEIPGEIADHRLVGDVLYIATTEWPDNWWSNREEKAKGNIFAFTFGKGEMKQVAHAELSSGVSARENMNIVEVVEGNAYKYYLVAILADSPWGWWDRKSSVEVVDISDPQGKIKPVMTVTAKGTVNKRSQTYIQNNTLVVASNYMGEKLLRIAVESFTFPNAQSKTISPDEANFRKLYIERELRGKSFQDPEARDVAYQALVNDPKLGLAGLFIDIPKSGLQKPVADSAVTVGDTHGLNADLKDVRVSSGKLYTFWLPSNNRDPLDVFDISAAEKAIKHLGHTEFEGWIERAEPISYKGKQFVLGLGWITPSVNNEGSHRYPQAMLFEITDKKAGKIKTEIVAQMNLSQSNVWVDFNRGDKYVEVRSEGEGVGSILFQISAWGKTPMSGGKLIGFDLNKAISGDDDKVFTEGATLAVDAGWLKRVFNNPEIKAKNTFSDLALGTFNVQGVGAAGQLAQAISVLELARNIRGYIGVAQGKGIQIISNENWYSWNNESKTEFRLVDSKRADSEKPAVLSMVTVPGGYSDHLVLADKSILVVGSKWIAVKGKDGKDEYHQQFTASRIALSGDKLVSSATAWFEDTSNLTSGGGAALSKVASFRPWRRYSVTRLVQVGGKIYLNTGAELREISVNGTELSQTHVNTSTCVAKTAVSVDAINGNLYATYSQSVEDPSRKGIQFERHFLAKASVQLARVAIGPAVDGVQTVLKCETPINIPGRAMQVVDKKYLIVDDEHVLGFIEHKQKEKVKDVEEEVTRYTAKMETVMISLKLDDKKGELVDMYDPSGANVSEMKLVGGTYVFLENKQYYEPQLTMLSLDSNLRFTKQYSWPNLQLKGTYMTLSDFVADPNAKSPNSYLALIASGRRAQVISWTSDKKQAEVKTVIPLNERFEEEKSTEVLRLANGYWSLNEKGTIHFSTDQRSLEISEGFAGVRQVLLKD